MDQPQKSVDRILQSLAPTLTDEFERAVREAVEAKETEFQARIEAAIRAAEQAAVNSATIRHQQVLEDVRREVERETSAQFRSRADEALKQVVDDLTAQFEAERLRLHEEMRVLRTYAEAHAELGWSGSQTEMLSRFLRLTEPFADAIAVYVMKTDGLALWKVRGDAAFPTVVSRSTIDPESYFKPVVVREKTVAAVSAPLPYRAEALDYLVGSLARSIEAFGMRLQTPVPRVPVNS
jgi:hypothetical protein